MMSRKCLSAFGLWLVSVIALGSPGWGQDPAPSPAGPAPAPAPDAGQAAPAAQPPPAATQPAVAPPSAGNPAGGAAPAAPPVLAGQGGPKIRFNFKGATFGQVIDFFSRSTGLPVIWKTEAPEGTLDYISPDAYEMPEALKVLNVVLQSKGVMLRVDDQKLHLQKLDQMQREDIPTFVGRLPEQVTPDQIVTVVYPLKIALAKPLAEKLAAMVATYGAVTPMEQQNALVITETAANIRRLQTMLDQLDKDDVEGLIEIFKIRNGKAADLMKPLGALLGTRVEKYIVNEKGQQIKIEENQMPGLTMSADERTNSIIAKGVQNQISKLRDAIQLLDAPGAGQERSMTTMALSRITPADAVAKLTQLYQKLPDKERPTVLALDDAAKVMIIGDDAAVTEGSLLVGELEGGPVGRGGGGGHDEPAISVVTLERANPANVIAAVTSLLNKRQQAAIKLIAGADGKSLIVSGLQGDVEAVKALIPVLDRQATVDKQVRLTRIASGDPKAVLEKARRIFDQSKQPDDKQMEMTAELDAEARLVTMIGPAKALDAFTNALRQVESNIIVDRQAKRIELANIMPSEIVAPVTSMAQQLLQPSDGSQYVAPTFAAIDQLNMLIVTATPQQFAVLDSLISSLDVSKTSGGGERPPLRILRLRIADAANLATIIMNQYNQRPPVERRTKPVNVAADPQSNSLIIAVHPDVLPEIQAIVEELDKTERLDLEGREIRIFPLKIARAQELAKTIDEMFPQPPVPVDLRGRPQPQLQKPREVVVRADAQTNSLIVDAPVQRMAGFDQLVEQLDRQQIVADTQVRTYQVVHADINALANSLRQIAASRALSPGGQDLRVPITVNTEPVSQTLIVSGPAEIFERVDQVLKDLDVKRTGPATTLRFFKLNHAKAESLAAMLRDVLTSRINQDVPDAGPNIQALLNVTADRKTNTLIISAPQAVMPVAEQLIKQLDDGSVSIGDPVVRVKPLTFADAANVSQSLSAALPNMMSKANGGGEAMAVKLIPAPGSNAIIMVGLEADLAEVEKLIEPLDARPATDAMDAKTFALQHAEAATIAPVVQRLLTDQQQTDPRIILERLRRSRGQLDLMPTIRVEADARTNSLIVSGPQQTVALAETLIKQLDAPDENSGKTYAVFTPRGGTGGGSADSSTLAQLVKRIIDSTRPTGRRTNLELIPEPQSGAIVIIGPEDETKRALELLKQRDDEALTSPQMDFRIVSLKNSQADAVAKTLGPMLTDRTRWPQNLQAAARAGITVGQPSVTADASGGGNRLMVSAPTELMPLANQIISELDRARAEGEAAEIRIFNLAQASATDVATALRTAMDARAAAQPGQPRVVIASEASSNSVIVTAAPQQLAEIEALIKPLDEFGHGADQSQVRTIFLKHARAENVASLVEKLLASEEIPIGIRYDAINRNRALPPTGPKVRVASDARLNAVMIAATPAVLNVGEQMVLQLDVDPAALAGAETRAVRVLTIENADAQQLAANLEAIFNAPDQLDAKPTIRVDGPSNSLLVRATEAQFKTIEQVVSQLDKATIASSRQMRMVPIDPAKASAEEIAQTLQRMLDRTGGSKVQVISLDELLKRREAGDNKEPPKGAGTSILDFGFWILDSPARRASEVDDGPQAGPERSAGPGPTNSPAPPIQNPAHRGGAKIQNPLPLPTQLAALVIALPQAPAPPDPAPPNVTIAVDKATNSLVILGSPRAVERVTALIKQIQDQIPSAPGTIRYIALPEALDATALTALINQTLEKIAPPAGAGQIGDFKKRVAVIADPASNALIVACNDADFETVADLIAALSKPASTEFPIRTITLARAEAAAVAKGIQQFFDDRSKLVGAAGGRGPKDARKRLAIMSVESSNTLLVSASDEDFAQVESLVRQFDTADAAGLSFRVFQLQHAKATDIERTVQRLVDDLTWNQGDMFFFWPPVNTNQNKKKDSIAVRADARLNTLIVTGRGDKFDVVEQMIQILDAPPPEGEQRVVKLYRLKNAPLQTVADVIKEVFSQGRQPRRPWEPADPNEIKIRADEASNVLIVSATGKEHEEIARLVTGIDSQMAASSDGQQKTQLVPVKFAKATELATTLTKFLADRAKAMNAPKPSATIVAADSANTLVISAPQAELDTLRDLLAQLDQPDIGGAGDRVVEILALQQGKADEIARILKEQFGRRVGSTPGVIVTADARTNSVIINAPQAEFAQAKALIERLDAPADSDETIIRTYSLKDSIADQTVKVLTQTLQLDSAGRTPGKGITIRLEDKNAPPVEVKARIVADKRSNSLIVTATEQSFPIIESLISKLEEVPAKNPQEWRIVTLKHAMAAEVSNTLAQITRNLDDGQPAPKIDANRLENKLIIAATADQFKQIDNILKQIDLPAQQDRITDFVPLKFAQAQKIQEALSAFYGPLAAEANTPGKRNVRIVADPATNSLVISAEKTEWEGVRKLLERLDSAEYDSSLQLQVLPLTYADAGSVARAINDAFSATVQRAARPGQARLPGFPTGFDFFNQGPSTTLVQVDEWVRASAEPQTNSVIISASRQNLQKVQEIINLLDVADYAKLPAPQIIPMSGDGGADPVKLAQTLTQLYEQSRPSTTGRKSLFIVGNAAANCLIVRAEDDEVKEIRALAEALQQQASTSGLTVHVLRLKSAPAARVANAIADAYQAKARQASQPLSIKVDPTGNSLIVASTGPLYEEIKTSVAELDAIAPAAGQGIFIIDLHNVPPETAKSVIETIGLDKPQPADSISRLVTEPIKVSLLAGRNAIVVVANPADRETIVGLMKAIDSEPPLAEAQTRVIKLKHAQASALAGILAQVLKPGDQQTDTPLAKAVKEQVRRLSIRTNAPLAPGSAGGFSLDLTKPVRVIPDPTLNALVVSSTAENVAALEQIVAMFDELPITDAVTVQLFPLQNISAEQFSRIVKEVFTQGKQLGKTVITNVPGVPEGAVGKALLEEIAISTDDRTNTVIVAGSEQAVALVEVLSKRIDSDVIAGWVEPKVLPLRFADAADLAETLQAILVEGIGTLPQSSPIQRQVGRLRMARLKPNGAPGNVVESDVFIPMTRLIIRAEPQMNALILVGTPANIEVVSELVTMLDIEAASPSNAVRIYPVENASAAKLATTIKTLFDQQVQSKAIRLEDRVIVQADERTNALVVATSPRSFAVLEGLLKTLDNKLAPEMREIRTLDVKNASAERLATLIQQMMDARLERLRKVQPETADLERATIVADSRTNTLVIAAGNESFEVIKRLAADLDTTTLGDAALVHVLPLEKGNIDRIAQAVNQIMERRYADMPPEVRKALRPLVLTDVRSNSLLVAANPEDLASIEDLVNKLAAAPINPAVGINLVTLPLTTRAEVIAPRVQRLMAERQASLGAAGTPSDKVSIEPDLASNSLIVAASDENLEIIRGLVDILVQAENAAGTGRELEIVTLSASNRAADIVDMLNDLYVREANRTRGLNTVRVTADERLNAVLVNAPAADVRAIKNLIAQLEGAKPANVVEIKYVPLKSANAVETVSLIENVLSGRGIGSRRGSRQATVLKYLREIARERTGEAAATQPAPDENAPVEMEVSAAIRESITLTPDLRTNTIIVSAPRESITMIERMIRDLDDSSTGSKNIRIFKLVNADAIAMADLLTELFRLKQGNSMYVLKPREDQPIAASRAVPAPAGPGAEIQPGEAASGVMAAPPFGGGGGNAGEGGGTWGTELTAVPDERQQLSITVDSRTNSLIVSGTPTYLDLVAKVVEELDKLEANEREVFVYQLRNSTAADVAKVIGDFVEQEQKKLVGTLSADQLGSAARLLEREITIQGDKQSNTVLVSASPRYMDRVKEMIKRLDVDPPQVLIQVMLAEVTLDTKDDWGVDMKFSGSVNGTDISGGFGLASAFVTGLGVPNLAIASSDFDLLIRAMKSQGRLQVLSNPSIMAANNAQARIQVGETVQVPSTTSISTAGQTSTTLEKEDLGVILNVTPSINPDGFVRMTINPEISNLSDRTTQVSEDFQSPIITRRTADTTVTVHDGQTIVLGGLISDRYERRDRKVPFFGDLPLFGALFRSNTETTAKTELLIVLTPHVIESPAEFSRVDQVTEGEIERLSLPQEVKDSIRRSLIEGTGGLYDAHGNRIKVKMNSEAGEEKKK